VKTLTLFALRVPGKVDGLHSSTEQLAKPGPLIHYSSVEREKLIISANLNKEWFWPKH
jgi:hypothetical protein